VRRLLVLAALTLSACTGVRVEPLPDVTLPACGDLDGVDAIVLDVPLTTSGVDNRSGPPRRVIEVFSAVPRVVQVLPVAFEADGEARDLSGIPAVLSPDAPIPSDYRTEFAQVFERREERRVKLRVDVQALCVDAVPDVPLPVWLSTEVETIVWTLSPGDL